MSVRRPIRSKYPGRGLGRGGKIWRKRARAYITYRRNMQFVPRTRGALAVTESKYFDTTLASTAIAEGVSWAGTELDPAANCLFYPSEGNDINNRVGRKVSVTKIHLRGTITMPVLQDQMDVVSSPFIRLILYMDQQTNAAQAQGEDVMATPGTGSAVNTVASFQNPANFGRFRVLRDKIYHAKDLYTINDAAATGSLGMAQIPVNLKYTFKRPLIVKFNATNGGTIADIVDNSFHLIGTKSGSGGAHTLAYECRVYYKDA